MAQDIKIGIIGGSGLYKMEALKDIEEVTVDTPFGAPSDAIITGSLYGTRVAFLARHTATTPFCRQSLTFGPISTP